MEVNFQKCIDRMGFHSLIDEFSRINVDPEDQIDNIETYSKTNKIGSVFKNCVRFISYSHVYFQYPKWKQDMLSKQTKNKLPDWEIHGFWLQFHVPFRFVSNKRRLLNPTSRSNVCCPIRVCFIYLFMLYMTIKYIIVSLMHVSFDRAIKILRSSVDHQYIALERKTNNHTLQTTMTDLISTNTNCIMLDQLNNQDRKLAKRISTLSNYLKLIGSPTSIDGLFFPYLLLLTVTAFLVLITFALLNPNNPKFRLNSWNLHFNPLLERSRLQARMRDLIQVIINQSTMCESNDNNVHDNNQKKQQRLHHCTSLESPPPSSSSSSSLSHKKGLLYDLSSSCEIISQNEFKLAKYYDNFCKYLRRKRYNYNDNHGRRYIKQTKLKTHEFNEDHHSIDWAQFANLFKWFERKLYENQQHNLIASASSSSSSTSTSTSLMSIPISVFNPLISQQSMISSSSRGGSSNSSSHSNSKHIAKHMHSEETYDYTRLAGQHPLTCFNELKQSNDNKLQLIPAHLTLTNYKILVKHALTVIAVSFCCLTSIGMVSCFVMFFRESQARIEQRFEEINCRNWNPSSIPRKMLPKLQEFSHPMDELAYMAIGPNDQLNLALRYELPLMLTIPTIQFCTEITCFYTIYCIWTSIYFLTAGLNHLNQTQWLDQINCQLKICSSLMDKYSQLELYLTTNLNAKEQIEKALSITYVNFMLFRREQKYDRPLFKFAVMQLSLIVFFGGLVTIWTLRNMDDRNGIIMWSITMFIVTLLNIMVHLLVTFTNKIYQIFDELNGIMCKSIQISMQESAIVGLWRRQIMSPQEVFNNFGVEIVGIKFTQANFIQFNSYIFGLSLYFLQAYS